MFVRTLSQCETPVDNITKIEYGGIPEWPKGADCKSVGNAFEGSNPSSSTIMREWLSGRASPCQGEGRGFESRLALIKNRLKLVGFFLFKILHIHFIWVVILF